MHTSTRLQASDFQFSHHDQGQWTPADFAAFCPDYHHLDRVGIVSPCLEEGVLHAGGALLALTTAFYDVLRARGSDFFDYPQHFALVGATGEGVQSGNGPLAMNTPGLWDAWSWLDVWPACKWITAPPTAAAMLQQIFDWQINRLFWPSGFSPAPDETPLPAYVQKMLQTHLKQIYLYELIKGSPSRATDVEVCAAGAAGVLLEESIARLPGDVAPQSQPRSTERYQRTSVTAFLSVFPWR